MEELWVVCVYTCMQKMEIHYQWEYGDQKT